MSHLVCSTHHGPGKPLGQPSPLLHVILSCDMGVSVSYRYLMEITMKLKTYENLYIAIEQQADRTWLLFNKVTGIYDDRTFRTYDEARNSMCEMTERYKIIARGRCARYV